MNISGLKVLVTGGAGFLGSHISEQLVEAGAKVSVLDTYQSGNSSNLANLISLVNFYQGDILDKNLVKQAMKGQDVVIHSAFPMAICDRSLNKQYIESGTVGIYNVLSSALAEDALFVYVSSISVYGKQQFVPITEDHPTNPMLLYGATKLAGELYCQVMSEEYGLRTVILRYSDIFGPRNGRVSAPIIFLIKALLKQPITINGMGTQVRSYTYASDAARAALLAINNPAAVGRIINIAGDESISIQQLVQKVQQVIGEGLNIQYDENVQQDVRNYIIDNTLAKNILAFQPQVSVIEGLNMTLKWLRANPDYFNSYLEEIISK